MCIVIDADNEAKLEEIRKVQKAIGGFSVKRIGAEDEKVRSVYQFFTWEKGINKANKWDANQWGFHFFFNLEDAKELLAVESTRGRGLTIIKGTVQVEDLLAVGVVDGLYGAKGKNCFTASQAHWDGTFIKENENE